MDLKKQLSDISEGFCLAKNDLYAYIITIKCTLFT